MSHPSNTITIVLQCCYCQAGTLFVIWQRVGRSETISLFNWNLCFTFAFGEQSNMSHMNDFGQSIGYARKCKNIKRRFCHKNGRALLLRQPKPICQTRLPLRPTVHVTNLTIWRFYSKTSFRFISSTLKMSISSSNDSALEIGNKNPAGLRDRHRITDYKSLISIPQSILNWR
jgi:hypothetical protein